jgi:Zn-dependent peptidase ImmA (M78 family)/DNA-binding XRE family transcriptional regulator
MLTKVEINVIFIIDIKKEDNMAHEKGFENIANNLRKFREAKSLSQEELAKRVGISRVGYRKIETQISLPRVSTLKALAEALSISIQDLVTPVNQLKHVRFRSQGNMNNRKIILDEISKKLEDYNDLEEILDDRIASKINQLISNKEFIKLKNKPKEAAAKVREVFSLGKKEPIHNICGLFESKGIKVISIRRTSNNFFGLSVSEKDGGPAVVVNIWERISVERWIFTAIHELAHLLFHLSSFDVCQIEENEVEEKEANEFASHFLMPDETFDREWKQSSGMIFVDRVLKIKRIFKVSYKTVLYRIQEKYKEINPWKLFHQGYKQKTNKSLTSIEEPDGLPNSAYWKSFPESAKAKEPDDLSPHDFYGERLGALVRDALKLGKITLSRGAEILGHDLMEMREIAKDWAASGEK